MGRKSKGSYSERSQGNINKLWYQGTQSQEIQITKETKTKPSYNEWGLFMDNRVATDNVIDTTVSHNTGSKLLDNVTFYNSHTTWNNSAN